MIQTKTTKEVFLLQLTDFDKELLSMTSVPEEVLQIIKDSFGLPIYQYFGYSDEELDYVPFDGVCVNLGKMQYPGHEIRAFVEELNRHFTERALPFTAFGSEYFIELEDGDDCVAVIPGTDAMAPVRAAGTAGFNAGISNEDIINTLLKWKTDFETEFKIIYADMQQIDAAFIKRPLDLKAFAEEIHDFSPDLIDRLEDGENSLVKLMTEDNMFSLYWD